MITHIAPYLGPMDSLMALYRKQTKKKQKNHTHTHTNAGNIMQNC